MSDAEFRQKYGTPQVCWSASDAPDTGLDMGYYFGPVTWMHPAGGEQITWSFYHARGECCATLVRLSGGEGFDWSEASQICNHVQMIAAWKFQVAAHQAFAAIGSERVERDARAAEAKRKLLRKQARERADAEASAAAAVARAAEAKRQSEETAAHQAWMSALRVDYERVLTEIKQGREGSLKLWSLTPGYVQPALGLEERKRTLAAFAERVAQEASRIEHYRGQIAERDAQAARYKAEREAQEARMKRLQGPIPLAPRDDGRIILGTAVADGYDRAWLPNEFQHMLVGGMTGSGKSVFLHQLVHQLLGSTEVDRVVLIDLKGGMEFDRYRNHPKVRIVWDLGDVLKTFEKIVDLLDARQAEMKSKGLRDWNGGRMFVIVDEYAEIHDSIHEARRGEEKENAHRLANNLKRIIRRARSLGVVMICALQKPTTDAMDSTLRANMNMRACFRVKTRQTAEAALDAFDELPTNPLELSKGRFVFDDGHGNYHYLQAQVAPGAVEGDDGGNQERTRNASTAA